MSVHKANTAPADEVLACVRDTVLTAYKADPAAANN
jgi:hypothetical protein